MADYTGGTIGYNVAQANAVMHQIADAYSKVGDFIEEEWPGVRDEIQKKWVGEDEQDFETKFAQRISTLYDNAYEVADASIKTIYNLANSWHEFQKSNTLDGTLTADTQSTFELDEVIVEKRENIAKPNLITITNDMTRGLSDANSAQRIQTRVGQYVESLRNKMGGLFNEIQADSAFFGQQRQNINNYIQNSGKAMYEVTVAVKDLTQALNVLAYKSYSNSDESVNSQMETAATNIESSAENLGDSRWV